MDVRMHSSILRFSHDSLRFPVSMIEVRSAMIVCTFYSLFFPAFCVCTKEG